MAFEYVLRLKTSLEPAQVLDHVLRSRPQDFTRGEGDDWLHGVGLVITATPCKVDPARRNFIEEEFRFRPTMHLCFRLDKFFEDSERSTAKVVDASLDLIGHDGGDALLQWNWEEGILLRRAGELILNSATIFWTLPGRLAWVTMPYTWEQLP